MGYYGAVYNTPPLGFNPQLVFAFPAFLTLPVVLASPIAENRREFLYFLKNIHYNHVLVLLCIRIGRRPVMTFSLALGGAAAALTLAVPEDM